MSSGARKPVVGKDAADILQRLAKKLSDNMLADIFPDLDSKTVRASLGEVAESISRNSEKMSAAKPRAAKSREKGGAKRRKPMSKGSLALFTDGASRGNPGEAGAGISILDGQGVELFAGGGYLGRCTNNVAEYRALIMGLDEALRIGGKDIVIHLDSELIVRQIQGAYKVKNADLKLLFAEVMARLDRFNSYQVAHVRREKNTRADQLANQAIDRKESL